jgi:uncharacterized membrane protein YfcA
LIGGVIAAPIAAFAAKRLPRRTMMALVGILICTLSLFSLLQVIRP